MELYRKKANFGAKATSGPDERYEDTKFNPSKRLKNLYLEHALKQNQSNIPNHPSKEDIFSDENSKQKPVKNINEKYKDIQSPEPKQFQKRSEKSMSPRRRGLLTRNREKNLKTSPIRNVLNISREPYYSEVGKRFNTIGNEPKGRNPLRTEENIPKKKSYRNNYNDVDDEFYGENQNDDESSYGEEEVPRIIKTSRSPEPVSLKNKFNKVMGKPRYNEARNKDIQVMPKLRKPQNNNYLNNNMNINTDEEVDELLKTIVDLQAIINGQKQDIRNIKKDNIIKDKKINNLRNKIDDLQKELDDKRTEHDKEIGQI